MEPLGIDHFLWRESPQGISIGGNTAMLRPRDMAKIGYLYLRNGTWNNEVVVSSDWISEATRTHTIAGGGIGYGYQIWTRDGIGCFSARGYAGQFIFVVLRYDLVVVFTATSGWTNTAIEDWIIPPIEEFGDPESYHPSTLELVAIAGVIIAVPAIALLLVYVKRVKGASNS